MGFSGGSDDKESTCNAGALGLIPGLGRSLEEGMATHSRILTWGIPVDGGAWWAAVHGVTKSRTRLSNYAHTAQKRIALLLCQAEGAAAGERLQTVCPALEAAVRSVTVKVQRGRGQLWTVF